MKFLKMIFLLSYCSISLMGMLIPIPFILWLIGSVLIFDNFTDQFFAVLGLTRIVLTIKKGFSALTSVPIFLFPILIMYIINWNRLKREKADRNL